MLQHVSIVCADEAIVKAKIACVVLNHIGVEQVTLGEPTSVRTTKSVSLASC